MELDAIDVTLDGSGTKFKYHNERAKLKKEESDCNGSSMIELRASTSLFMCYLNRGVHTFRIEKFVKLAEFLTALTTFADSANSLTNLRFQ